MEDKKVAVIKERCVKYPAFVDTTNIGSDSCNKGGLPFRFSLTIPFINTESGRFLRVIMKNPSYADVKFADNTVRKVCNNAYQAGYGGIIIVNLFPYRAANASDVYENYYKKTDLYKETMAQNFRILEDVCDNSDVYYAWGTDSIHDDKQFRAEYDKVISQVIQRVAPICSNKPNAFTFDISGKYPLHPLRWKNSYLKDRLKEISVFQAGTREEQFKPTYIKRQLDRDTYPLHSVLHRNIFGFSAEVAGINDPEDFKIYCRKEHKICLPNCTGCKYFEGTAEASGINCRWNDYIPTEEHVVQHDERELEFARINEEFFGSDDLFHD